MKILIFYGSYGGGHLSAARSIKEYIDLNYKDSETLLVDCVEYVNKAVNKVSTRAFAEMAKSAPKLWGKMYSNANDGYFFAKITNISNNVMAIKLDKLLDEFNPDLVISTHPFSSQMCAQIKKKNKRNFKLATVLTDYAPHEQWIYGNAFVDYYFVAHDKMRNEIIAKGIDKNKVYSTGIPLSNKFLQSYNKEETLANFGLKPNKRTVLFFAGGEFGFIRGKTYAILKSFINSFPDFQLVAIAGKNINAKKRFDKLVEENNREDTIKVLQYTDKIAELMSVSDLVITKPGGLTSTESLASGLPIVIINPIPGQEEENAEFLQEHNAAVWIKNKADVQIILKDLFESPDKIRNMKINARLLAKKNSTKDICEILLT